MGAGFLHQLKNFGDCGLLKVLGGLDMQNPCHVDAAADDLLPRRHLPGLAFPCQGYGVQRAAALQHYAIQRDFFAWLHHNHTANLHLVRVNPHQLAITLNIGIIWPYVHQLADIPAAPAHGIAFKKLPHLIEKHHGNSFQAITALVINRQQKSTDRSHRHQEILIKNLTVPYAPRGLAQYIIGYQKIGHQVQRHLPCACNRNKLQDYQQQGSQQDTRQ